MKRLVVNLVITGSLLLFAEVNYVYGPLWVMDNTGAMGSAKFRGICVVNDSLVWVVGENGKVYKRTGGVHSHQWVQITIDVIPQTNYHFNDVCFVDAFHGWIVGEKRSDPNKYEGVVVWTDNGGTNWHLPTSMPTFPLPTPFLKVKMANVYRGYISCGNGVILGTLNGGDNWFRCKSPWDNPLHPGDSTSIWYNGLWVDPNNPNNLWVSGDAFGILAKSNDGGAHWTVSQTNAFDQSYTFPPNSATPYGTKLGFFDVDFSNPNVGYVALSYGRIGKTTNGGASWTVTQYEPQATWFYDVAKGRGDTAFAVGNFGVVHRFTGTTEEQEHFNFRWSSYFYTDPATDFLCIGSATGNYAYAAGKGPASVRQRYLPASGQQFSLRVKNVDLTDFVLKF